MASSNPFRKNALLQENRLPPIDRVDQPHQVDEGEPLAARGQAKKKSNKKVRVLSPPPRSPDNAPSSSELFARGLPQDTFDSVAGDATAPRREIQWPVSDEAAPPNSTQTLANPFSKATQDDGGTEGPKPANSAARRSLNVDSFKRLLLTGAASPPKSPSPLVSPSDHGRPDDDPRSDDAFKNTEGHDTAMPAPSGREKKPPPPPPSSRHGKSLKTDIKEAPPNIDDLPTLSALAEKEQSRWRPPIPRSSSSDSSASSPSRESTTELAVPEAPPVESPKSQAAPSNGKKPVPAPPPPRGHSRSESKALNATRATRSAFNPQDSDPPSRTSMESDHSRPSSIRQSVSAPAPPPPRRPTIGPRQPDGDPDYHLSLSPVRPPPTRPAESSSRRVSRESMGPPPPPPSRHRGNSEGKKPRSSSESLHEPASALSPTSRQSNDLLADLDALQREVDALRGAMR